MNLESLPADVQSKLARCREVLRSAGRVVVGVSGGVDSSLLLALSVETLGRGNVIAATAVGFLFPAAQTRLARRLAQQAGVELVEVDLSDLREEDILANSPRRCYWCKRYLFGQFVRLAERRGFSAVLSGSNADDLRDYRPGERAESELGVIQPLRQARLTKREIRAAAKAMGLANWDEPSDACLASRVQYGRALSDELLRRIETAEAALKRMGFRQPRLRDHGTVARIEIPPGQLDRAVRIRDEIIKAMKDAGYTYVALDLEGFRSGSGNEILP